MEFFVSAVLEEICAEGPGGIPLSNIWGSLQSAAVSFGLPMDDAVKEAIWNRVLALPNLLFKSPSGSFSLQDVAIKSVDQAEKMGLRIVAEEHLRDCFLGIYDLKASNSEVSPTLKQVLERLAVARSNGITQNQLSKELKMKENKLFYYLKKLEAQGLIVRQATLLRTKEGNATKDTAIVNTNLIHLYRYAKRLTSLQRVEITTPNLNGDQEGIGAEEQEKEDVNVKDFLPEMIAICKMLEESPGKVLVVSDIKVARGYRMTRGHRSWRNICNRMKEACLVEDFMGKVNGKVVKCLRLLKNFNPKDFQPKVAACGYENFPSDPLLGCSRRGQITDQFVELPLEHRIYDIIDGQGTKGITISEVGKRLGINGKKTESRICDMCWRMPKRFPLHMRFENYNRTKVYRVWTLRNFQDSYSDGTLISDASGYCEMDGDPDQLSTRENPMLEKSQSGQEESVLVNDLKDRCVTPVEGDVQSEVIENNAVVHDTRDVEACKSTLVLDSSSYCSFLVSTSAGRLSQKHSSAVSVDSAQREERILGRLKNEKFLLTVELHKWLEGLEKDKQTTMARKTLTRALQKLQKEGYCKCIQISVPVLTNCNRNRAAEVILHPSIENISSELLGQIHQRLREFDLQSHGQGSDRQKNGCVDVSELKDVKRPMNNRDATESQSLKIEIMRINGYVPAIMVRAKLLHSFLWSFVRDLPGWDGVLMNDDEKNDTGSSCSVLRSFSLALAIENMSFELFLQVVGSEKRFDDLIEKCRLGLRLCALPPYEFKDLMDTHATGRLSRVIDILYRLKLIQLATEGVVANTKRSPLCLSTYSLELKPFIEVPRSSSSADASSARLRHDFVLTTRDSVDSYWQTLEYCHVSAERNSSSKTFPGSAVKELFLARSWTSVRVMKAEQNTKLLERLGAYPPCKKVPFVECVKISKELDLTLEQVLRAAYDMRQGRCRRFLKNSNGSKQLDLNNEILNIGSVSRKRKRPGKLKSPDKVYACGKTKEASSSRSFKITDDDDGEEMDEMDMHSSERNGSREANLERNELPSQQPSLSRKKSKRQRKFYWSPPLDRKLVIEYVKYRAPFGAKFCRVDWTSIGDLPADPDTCKRRMYILNSDRSIRKKVMKLCNLVSSRYARFLRESKEERDTDHDNPRMEKWDDFDDPEVTMAVDGVLGFKTMAKSKHKLNISSRENQMMLSLDHGNAADHDGELLSNISNDVSVRVYKHVSDSLSVANAVELFKLIFLSTSTAPEVRSLLAETLKLYSEADLTMAFNYLREMKLMEHGHGNNQLVLSQRFLMNTCSSPFPLDSGKRAAKFSAWLHDEGSNLNYDGVNLNFDLQCGEIFQFLALIHAGRLSVRPCVPEEGVGEADDSNNPTHEALDEKTMKQKVWWRKESEPCNRREKGFPGIKMLLQRKAFSTTEILPIQTQGRYDDSFLVAETFSDSRQVDRASALLNVSLGDSIYESMAAYASRLNSTTVSVGEEELISPQLIKDVYKAVQLAGEQGLRVDELSRNIVWLDDELVEVTVDTLAEFQLAVKVNAYDHVRVVDSSYKLKYFIVTLKENKDDSASKNPQQANYDISRILLKNHENSHSSDAVTRFHSEEEHQEISAEGDSKYGKKIKFLDPVESRRCQAILPWINGDGSTNDAVYRGLVRRVLGTVMQNPGILEEDIMNRMIVLNPQSCRQLLDLMILDDHIIMKKMLQETGCGPPSILGHLFSPKGKSAEAQVFRRHYFANPMSASQL